MRCNGLRPLNIRVTPARFLSHLFQPVLTSAYLLAFVSLTQSSSLRAGMAWFLLTAGITAGLPSLFIALAIRRGRVTDFDIRMRKQRLVPLIIALACSLLSLVVCVFLHAPRVLIITIAAGLLPGIALTIVTRFWQISFHTATLAGALAVAIWLAGPVALVGMPALPAVAWSRVELGRHSVAQVVAGALAGGLGAAAVIWGARAAGL